MMSHKHCSNRRHVPRLLPRRQFLQTFPAAAVAAVGTHGATAQRAIPRTGTPLIKLSLNAYSFNSALRSGRMSVEELLEFCARQEFDAVDLTGYYLAGYPKVPELDEISRIKKRAFQLGLEISGTGVRNDFTQPDEHSRAADIELVNDWLGASARLGAPNLRIFAGRELPEGADRAQVTGWVIESIKACLPAAQASGVVLAIQNHYEFIKTPEHLLSILSGVNSDWVAVNLDIGSFRSADPYDDVSRIAPMAVAWQIKEIVYPGGQPAPVDLRKVVQILRESAYRGYILVETLGEGDPAVKVPRFLSKVREALSG